jgi:hypothetical protein
MLDELLSFGLSTTHDASSLLPLQMDHRADFQAFFDQFSCAWLWSYTAAAMQGGRAHPKLSVVLAALGLSMAVN